MFRRYEFKAINRRLSILKKQPNYRYFFYSERRIEGSLVSYPKRKITQQSLNIRRMERLLGPVISPLCKELTFDVSKSIPECANAETFYVSRDSKSYSKLFQTTSNMSVPEQQLSKSTQATSTNDPVTADDLHISAEDFALLEMF